MLAAALRADPEAWNLRFDPAPAEGWWRVSGFSRMLRSRSSVLERLGRYRVILAERLVAERFPLVVLRGRHDHPLPEHFTPAGRIEEMCSWQGEGAHVGARIGQLEHHPRAGEAEHDLAGALHARHPEHLPGARVVVPGADRVDDVLVAFVRIQGAATLRPGEISYVSPSNRPLHERDPTLALRRRHVHPLLHHPPHVREA